MGERRKSETSDYCSADVCLMCTIYMYIDENLFLELSLFFYRIVENILNER